MVRSARTYANSQQVARLAWTLWSQGTVESKPVLEPRKYEVDGINYKYQEVDVAIQTLMLVNGAFKQGQLKATKKDGMTVK